MAPRIHQFANCYRARAAAALLQYMGKLIPAHCQSHCAGWLAGCISHRRQDVERTVCIVGRLSLFNGLAANDR